MNTDTLFYYFGPLVTFWFLLLYLSMALLRSYNSNLVTLLIKLFITLLLSIAFTHIPPITNTFFEIINSVFGLQWDAKESAFRLSLDQYAVYTGILIALLSHFIHPFFSTTLPGSQSTTSLPPLWYRRYKTHALLVSALLLSLYLLLLMTTNPTKSFNNAVHPYVSPFLMMSFIILRNATPTLRNTTSLFWRWIGTLSLDTFILQYHLWLAVDTKGLWIVLPPSWNFGGNTLNLFVATVVFLAASEWCCGASGVIVDALCTGGSKNAGWVKVSVRVGVVLGFLVVINHTLL
jgi:N-acetylneuraminate 9-O-acetyltransferase